MTDRSSIEWTGATWNPIRSRAPTTGELGWICVRVSAGCINCYAATMNAWRGNGEDYTVPGLKRVEPFLDEHALTLPLRWKAPRKIFVCSMTDLFGEWVQDEWLHRIFDLMSQAPQHIFQVLTKRAARMRDYIAAEYEDFPLAAAQIAMHNVWLGVSVENQPTADERIPTLLQTPAAVRWVSYEPALGPVDFRRWVFDRARAIRQAVNGPMKLNPDQADSMIEHPIDWIVIGGESGPGARPFDLAWARATIAKGRAAGVPVFVKQLGAQPFYRIPEGTAGLALRDRKGGDPAEWPEDLRVREYPERRA